METFTKEIVFLGRVFDSTKNDWIDGEITKTATFNELSRKAPEQRELCWITLDILDLKNKTPKIDSETACKLVDLFIDKMLIVNETFTEQDKKEFLSDNTSVISFGFWLIHEKIIPFFLQLRMI